MSVEFSVIVCTYNPVQKIFKRLLHAIASFNQFGSIPFELILVDNNSKQPVAQMKEVQELVRNLPVTKTIVEKKSGLTSARLAGHREAGGKWLIFFDDDNEPAADYLEVLKNTIQRYPAVGCWGPGTIKVEYTDTATNEWLEKQKLLFQQRQAASILFDDKKRWQHWYPVGTGMAIRRDVMDYYVKQVREKRYTLTDRKGKDLSSGGDVQIVLSGIKLGYKAGTIPSLRVQHLISKEKANIWYLQKQRFGTSSCYLLAHEQVFPELAFRHELLSNKEILKHIYSVFRNHYQKNGIKDFLLQLSKTMGEINARYMNAGVPSPLLMRFYQRMIHA